MSVQKKSLVSKSKPAQKAKTASATSESIKGKAPKGEKQTSLIRR